MDKAGIVNTYLIEIFKNHKLIKIFQKETYETARADEALTGHMNRSKKLMKFLLDLLYYGSLRYYDCYSNILFRKFNY